MTTPHKERGTAKTARIPIKIVPAPRLKKPEWIRVKLASGTGAARFHDIQTALRAQSLHTVC